MREPRLSLEASAYTNGAEDIYTKVRWKWATDLRYLGLSQVLYKKYYNAYSIPQ